MVAGGLRWTPPDPAKRPDTPPAPATTGKARRESSARRVSPLRRLRHSAGCSIPLTLERRDIERGMIFALDRAEAADDVAELLVDALAGQNRLDGGENRLVPRLRHPAQLRAPFETPLRTAARFKPGCLARSRVCA